MTIINDRGAAHTHSVLSAFLMSASSSCVSCRICNAKHIAKHQQLQLHSSYWRYLRQIVSNAAPKRHTVHNGTWLSRQLCSSAGR